ncbi:MAG: ATP synthase F1 subunit epsilon [Planctomycetes bacterium]|nr:ATP synthase F1 subunit epsilon [Planctomycetota bacterium]
MSAQEKESFQLEIITPEREVLKTMVTRVAVTGQNTIFEILPGHEALLCPLGVGLLGVQKPGEDTEDLYAVHGGFLEVSDDAATILADSAEHGDEVDLARAREAMQRAKDKLATRMDTGKEWDLDRADLALRRALARINASEKNYFI